MSVIDTTYRSVPQLHEPPARHTIEFYNFSTCQMCPNPNPIYTCSSTCIRSLALLITSLDRVMITARSQAKLKCHLMYTSSYHPKNQTYCWYPKVRTKYSHSNIFTHSLQQYTQTYVQPFQQNLAPSLKIPFSVGRTSTRTSVDLIVPDPDRSVTNSTRYM
jgi:hypothetical protein